MPPMTVRIVTDSTSDIPPGIAAELGITVVPLTVRFGDEEMLDSVDITSEQFFKRLQRDPKHPTTAQPSPGQFREVYDRLVAEGATAIVSCHISSKLSGTFESARQASEGLSVPVHLVDSKLFSLALSVGTIEAAKAARNGQPVEEVKAVAEDTFRRTHVFITLETLEYLRRGGRLSRGQELVGSLLKVKPILTAEDGAVEAVGRVRTKPKALEEIVSRVADLRPWSHAFAIHASTPEDIDYVNDRFLGLSPDTPVLTNRMGPVIGVYAGPGGVGVGCVTVPDGDSPMFLPS